MYTIKIEDNYEAVAVLARLQERLKTHGMFVLQESRVVRNRIELAKVRLIKTEDYYGNTPNADDESNRRRYVGFKPKKMRYLSWARWVEFNGLVNDVLDELKCVANVWSKPQSTTGKLWIRKNGSRREEYRYEEGHNGYRTTVSIDDKGTDEQFGNDVTLTFPNMAEV